MQIIRKILDKHKILIFPIHICIHLVAVYEFILFGETISKLNGFCDQ